MNPRARRRWILVVAICALVAIPILVPTFTLHRAKARILATLSRQMGRRVGAESLHLVLFPWPGFELDNVQLADAPDFGLENLATASDAVATLRLLPLWSGHIEFSSIRLDDANINLVRNAAGRWNLADLLDRAAAAVPRLRPTAAPPTLGAPERFPYLALSDGRINFKFGLFKRPFYLDGVNGSLTLERDAWRLHVRFVPRRSDLNLSDTGQVTLDGRWRRASGLAFRDVPFDLSAHFSRSYLAGSIPLLLGRDAGVHGIIAADLQLRGTGQDFSISGVVRGLNLRRWDQLPTGLDLSIPFAARYRAATDTLALLQLGDGAHFDVTGSIARLLTSPAASLDLSLRAFPAAALVPVVRALDARLPASLGAGGTLDGSVALAAAPGAPIEVSGRLHAEGLAVTDDETAVRVGTFACRAAVARLACAGEGDLGPSGLRIGTVATASGLALSLSAADLGPGGAHGLAVLTGVEDPWLAALRGAARLDWSISLPWSRVGGQSPALSPRPRVAAFWPRATLAWPQLASPLTLRSLRLARSPAGSVTVATNVLIGAQPWRLSAARTASGDGASPWRFALTAAHGDATALARALRPRRQGLFASLLESPPSIAPLLATVRAEGSIRIADFAWRGHHAALRAELAAGARGWSFAPVALRLAGGTVAGRGEWRRSRLRFTGHAAHVDLAALLASGPYAHAIAGAGSGDVEVALAFPTEPADLAVAASMVVRNGSFPALHLPFARFATDLTWRDGAARFAHTRVVTATRSDSRAALALLPTGPGGQCDLVLSRPGASQPWRARLGPRP